jgi:hypothetical protein
MAQSGAKLGSVAQRCPFRILTDILRAPPDSAHVYYIN